MATVSCNTTHVTQNDPHNMEPHWLTTPHAFASEHQFTQGFWTLCHCLVRCQIPQYAWSPICWSRALRAARASRQSLVTGNKTRDGVWNRIVANQRNLTGITKFFQLGLRPHATEKQTKQCTQYYLKQTSTPNSEPPLRSATHVNAQLQRSHHIVDVRNKTVHVTALTALNAIVENRHELTRSVISTNRCVEGAFSCP